MKNHEVVMPIVVDELTKSGTCWHCDEYVESWFFIDDDKWTKFGTVRQGVGVKNLNRFCSAPRKPLPDFKAIRSWRELSRWPEVVAFKKELKEKYDKVYNERFRGKE